MYKKNQVLLSYSLNVSLSYKTHQRGLFLRETFIAHHKRSKKYLNQLFFRSSFSSMNKPTKKKITYKSPICSKRYTPRKKENVIYTQPPGCSIKVFLTNKQAIINNGGIQHSLRGCLVVVVVVAVGVERTGGLERRGGAG